MQQSQFNRQIIIDTETTGLNKYGLHFTGHKIIEIGAIEIINRRHTGNYFHHYIKPDREVDPEAVAVHGIDNSMLEDKPYFADIATSFIDFIRDSEVIIHNAPFDVGFLDYEFELNGNSERMADICHVTDTLAMARNSYPGKRNSLDALADRLNIDRSKRTMHGALLDAQILADVYLAMTGGQGILFDEQDNSSNEIVQQLSQNSQNFTAVIQAASAEELAEHEKYLAMINKKSKNQCLWTKNDE